MSFDWRSCLCRILIDVDSALQKDLDALTVSKFDVGK